MTPEHFLLFADPLPEPMLLVSGEGRILAANRANAKSLQMHPQQMQGRNLAELVADAPERVARYLGLCSRNRQMVLGALTVRTEDGPLSFRTEGTLIQSKTDDSEARLMLRFKPKEAAVEQFLSLNQRIEELGKEIQRRKLLETEVRAQKERLQVTLQSIGDGVIVCDLEGRVWAMNPVAEFLTGWTESEAVGQPLEEVFHIVNEDTRQTVENPALRALREGVIVGLANHTNLIAKDGSERAIDDSAAPIRDAEGNVFGAVLIFRDMTARKQAESQLRESEARFRLMADAAPVLIWVSDAKKRGIYFNQRWLEFTGRSLEDELGEGWLANIHPEDRERAVAICGEAFQRREPFQMEFRMRRADGEYRWILNHGVPRFTEQGELTGYVGTCTDLTERREAEKALQENEQRLQAVLEILPLPLYIADAKGRLELTNLAADALWGQARLSESLETYSDDYHALWPHTGKRVESHEWGMARALAQGEHVTAEEMELLCPNGQRRMILNYARPIRNAEGQIAGGVAVNVDITDLKRAEEKLREADRRKDEFLATLAHELRNPLAPIRTGLELLKTLKDNPAELEDIRSTMERQTDQLIRLVNDLLDISRITQGKFEIRKRRVNLADVLQSALEASLPFVEEAGHTLTANLPDQPIHLDADSHRLTQVFSNLLSNAAKYTPEGGRIWLSVACQKDEVLVSVKDNGVGIPAEKQESIFEMFAQIEHPIEKLYTGLGIGLTLAKSLVDMHEGTIEVSSDGPSQGSEFRVRLPILIEQPPAEQTLVSSKAESGGNKQRVLVVDDNKAAADMLSLVVRNLGNDVRTAYDGLQALEVAAEFQPNIVLMDLGMPKMNGYEAASRIRQAPWGKTLVLVALTGWGQDEDKRRTREAGFDQHLVKPADPTALLQVLSEAAQRSP